MSHPNVVILGAGVVGLSLALELHRRGIQVALYEPRAAATQASWAAAGMLAAQDPFNPPQLSELARFSAALYPAYLESIAELSGEPVPFQTSSTVQHLSSGDTTFLRERSIDPRQLATSLLSAVQQAGIPLMQKQGQSGSWLRGTASVVVHAMGAWAESTEIFPRKGQMLRVQLPSPMMLQQVHRSEHVYVVPRLHGPQKGTALIGATVEDAGFNTDTSPIDLAQLRRLGFSLLPDLPELADAQKTPMVEAWAGLRPATSDGLPLIGPSLAEQNTRGPRQFIAAGHFRNGILLAPATAVVIADLIQGRGAVLDLTPFSPSRFSQVSSPLP